MGKSRETRIILKTDHRTVILEMLIGGKFQAKSGGWDRTASSSEAMFVKLKYAMAAGC
jgi:hypothetical protein